MIDAYIRPLIDPSLTKVGALVAKAKISANTVTLIGFLFGLAAMISIALGQSTLGGFLFILNRISDGLDGGVARATKMSDFGGVPGYYVGFYYLSWHSLGLLFLRSDLCPARCLPCLCHGRCHDFLSSLRHPLRQKQYHQRDPR